MLPIVLDGTNNLRGNIAIDFSNSPLIKKGGTFYK